jgi:hypothetical protein
MEEKYKICKFFIPIERIWKDSCHRYPPTINTVWTSSNPLSFYTKYPPVYDDQWCGEFAEAPAEPA